MNGRSSWIYLRLLIRTETDNSHSKRYSKDTSNTLVAMFNKLSWKPRRSLRNLISTTMGPLTTASSWSLTWIRTRLSTKTDLKRSLTSSTTTDQGLSQLITSRKYSEEDTNLTILTWQCVGMIRLCHLQPKRPRRCFQKHKIKIIKMQRSNLQGGATSRMQSGRWF